MYACSPILTIDIVSINVQCSDVFASATEPLHFYVYARQRSRLMPTRFWREKRHSAKAWKWDGYIFLRVTICTRDIFSQKRYSLKDIFKNFCNENYVIIVDNLLTIFHTRIFYTITGILLSLFLIIHTRLSPCNILKIMRYPNYLKVTIEL